jgi:hypothetical protein
MDLIIGLKMINENSIGKYEDLPKVNNLALALLSVSITLIPRNFIHLILPIFEFAFYRSDVYLSASFPSVL